MQNQNIQGTGVKIVIVACMMFILLGVSVLAFGEWTGWFSMFPVIGAISTMDVDGSRVYYPQKFSMCCDNVGDMNWVPVGDRQIDTYTKTYTCPSTTSQCRVKEPDVECPGISFWHPLGWQRAWIIQYTDYDLTEYNYCNFHSLGICSEVPVNGLEFKSGENVQYAGSCIDRNVFLSPTNFVKLLTLLNGGSQVASGNLKIEALRTGIYYDSPNVGRTLISGTDFCKAPDTINQNELITLKNNELKDGLLDKVQAMAEDLLDKSLDRVTPSVPTSSAKEASFPLRLGECITGVETWVDMPSWGNINKQGQYQGKDVICGSTIGIVEVQEVETYNNVKFYAPMNRLQPPDHFCCSNADCDLQFPLGTYGCENYECVEGGQAQCVSDIECQPEGGLNQGRNCYRDLSTSEFYLYNSKCVSGQCTVALKIEVECCADYCSQFGKQCDYETGCVDVIPPKPDCPPGQCCDGYTHKPQQCSGDLVCCLDKSIDHNGICKTYKDCYGSLPTGCMVDDDCSDDDWLTIDSCQRTFLQKQLGQKGTCNHYDVVPIMFVLIVIMVLIGMGLFVALITGLAIHLKKKQQTSSSGKAIRRK